MMPLIAAAEATDSQNLCASSDVSEALTMTRSHASSVVPAFQPFERWSAIAR